MTGPDTASAQPIRLLLVDDDAGLAAMLLEYLAPHGFHVTVAGDGETALARLDTVQPELVVLDVMLPGIDGFEVLRRLRGAHDVPVLMLTARGEAPERIAGILGGADDYLGKPFEPLELAARLHAVLKRSRGRDPLRRTADSLTVGALTLDLRRCVARFAAHEIALTRAELRVLEQLMRREGQLLPRATLTELALDRPLAPYDRSIDTLVSKLRRKLADAGLATPAIRSLRGHGYVLDATTHESN